MTHTRTRLALPLGLPGVPDERDACVARPNALLAGRPGIERVHVVPADDGNPALLCPHYDPARLPLAGVEAVGLWNKQPHGCQDEKHAWFPPRGRRRSPPVAGSVVRYARSRERRAH